MAQPRVIFINCLYLAKLNPELRIGSITQLVERFNDSLDIAGSGRLCATFFEQCSLVRIYVFTSGTNN